jgi:hypothetical protein
MEYVVREAHTQPQLNGDWDGPTWWSANCAEIANFRPEGSEHCPHTQVKLLYDSTSLYGLFRVEDMYVRSVRTKFMEPVSKDSCVEFFVQPKPTAGYYNFEFNCGGALLAGYVVDPTRKPGGGLTKAYRLRDEDGQQIGVYHSMPDVVDPEIQEPVEWYVEFNIPLAILAKYVGPLGPLPRQQWRGNFFKCGDQTSHPHWASWTTLEERNFHAPASFGTLVFE